MFGFIDSVLKFFGFVEQQETIALVCLLAFLVNFLGGLIRSIVLAFAGPIKDRNLKDRMSFRLSMASLLLLAFYALYYHAILVQKIEVGHLIYWGFSVLAAPLLGIIGSEITGLIFAKPIASNREAFRRWDTAQRAEKFAEAEKRAQKKKSAAERRR